MIINKVKIEGFRNFERSEINFNDKTLIIGSNDVGKTNLIYALRLLLDKSLSERDIEPELTDFHIAENGEQSESFSIEVYFSDITEDAVLATLKGNVSDDGESLFKLKADKNTLEYELLIGSCPEELEVVPSRYYLKYVNLRYVRSRRDLKNFINSEKKHLLKLSQTNLAEEQISEDHNEMAKISRGLEVINKRVARLNYVKDSTSVVNQELKKLAYSNDDYSIQLDSGAIKVNQFIENLELGASSSGSKITLGGDGRNNQILLALWKAKSQREFDPDYEVTFYCVEEPEAHLHPHQQRKLADYLISELAGQTIITSHSPQITERYSPDSIINLINRNGSSKAASSGCSNCISEAWDNLGYRMSILPAEAFFASCVILVEGPSEKLFYHEMATAIGIDLDFYNISILSVDGVQFEVYINILDSLEIPWVMRTDNDVSKVPRKPEKRLAGVNRCQNLAKLPELPNVAETTFAQDIVANGTWQTVSSTINPLGIFLAKIDLENDLALEMENELKQYSGKDDIHEAIKFIQLRKAIRMREFLSAFKDQLPNIAHGEIAKPLMFAIAEVSK
ncbi:ATP-dependent endonuclease [Pseudoalteromonas sp. NBT06-2]|jgi:putative ATP-dependent endonuclease of OLD family|uniref:ATP-dependent nuclease n=1 Tax=Pseudoalteromonas sp. NBT06-2 TaxID=2025950 RepID=UPI000BA739DB|nr:AAA family ATPase [Pseudoalteromonas sp. NBT06-2]PAJ72541.1 ATP-dependent endonuclease [Pseudoalteromonas sp. NBT06-2]